MYPYRNVRPGGTTHESGDELIAVADEPVENAGWEEPGQQSHIRAKSSMTSSVNV